MRATAGSGAEDAAQASVDDGRAWIEFCESLKGLADYVVPSPGADRTASPAPATGAAAVDALDRREGLRYMSRVLRGGVEAFLESWDPAYPVLRPLPYNVKLGADNPDNLYMYGTVSGAFEYRIRGTRGTVTYLSFGCYSGSRPGQGSSRPDHLDSSRLVTQEDGSFEIFLTPQPRGKNWLRLPADASRIVVRQTFLDRTKEVPADLHIERLPLATVEAAQVAATASSASGAASIPVVDPATGQEDKPALTAGQVVSGLAGASVFINGSVMQFQAWSRQFAARPNTLFCLDHDVYMSAWADPAIYFLHGYWRLGPQQALLIQATPPECPYWNFQLDNWWMESLDYANHPAITVNKATARYMPDKSICLVVAHADPRRADGSPDSLPALLKPALLAGVTWIDTAHHSHGTMGLRWVLAKQHPLPRCTVVELGQPLADAIAAGVSV
ncbi:hypothetical protein CHLRE_01g018450v5 [Chlamydomonas reinhardtii]|uniref:DUF1214 domain-containing protein n=1 Tax=Chlamydomonas reinhardtii TaxID=3055 RepID=A0A2K3E602_CHLRE|nr:uncharacterized protein CHLRE_01g018450v5 [Chlamydomonas reinhardtii]PNW88193.1 hypothetical protein CHLRE_01g018450v5 [Chlamydomonas reinhardtii]